MDMVQMVKGILRIEDKQEDICGLCGRYGADKIPHPVYWPGENAPGTEYVHATCEDAECRRAHSMLSDRERERFLSTI